MIRILCHIFGHEMTFNDTFTSLGQHVGVRKCKRCQYQEISWRGPIFPGEAEDPDKAVRYIEEYCDYDPPDPDGPAWEAL